MIYSVIDYNGRSYFFWITEPNYGYFRLGVSLGCKVNSRFRGTENMASALCRVWPNVLDVHTGHRPHVGYPWA